MAHAWNYAVNGTDIEQWCDNVRIMPERSPAMRGANPVVPFQHGELDHLYRKFGSDTIFLETLIKITPDWFTNRSNIADLLMDTTQTVRLQRDLPSSVNVEIPVRCFIPPTTTSPRFRVVWPLRTVDPFWRDRTQRTGLTSPITVNGDAPVGDAVITFTAGTNTRLTHTESGKWIEITGAATNVIVDMGARTITLTGADHDANFDASDPEWIELFPGTNTFAFTGGGAATVALYDKYF